MIWTMIMWSFDMLKITYNFYLTGKDVTQVAAHPEGKHYLALTKSGDVYSWGNGDWGELGHGDTSSLDSPKIIQDLSGRSIVFIAGERKTVINPHYLSRLSRVCFIVVCGNPSSISFSVGSAYSAAVTSTGELYTWGKGI